MQSAYDREAAVAGALHDPDVVIVGVDCAAFDATKFTCQVGFKKRDENSDRVYLDAALIERERGGWETAARSLPPLAVKPREAGPLCFSTTAFAPRSVFCFAALSRSCGQESK